MSSFKFCGVCPATTVSFIIDTIRTRISASPRCNPRSPTNSSRRRRQDSLVLVERE
jgi:hypothetical protein